MTNYVKQWLGACGLKPRFTCRVLSRIPAYLCDYRAFGRSARGGPWEVRISHPCLDDKDKAGGVATGHYFHQDLFVAQRIFARQPRRHCDVGSRVDGFVAHVASFRSIEYFDVRPITAKVGNIVFRRGDLLQPESLPKHECDSVSALHVIEHVGLGRYGDAIAADGWETAFRSLAAMVAPGGVLYISVPVGHQRVEFNAHRIFNPTTIVCKAQQLGLALENFAWVDDDGDFHPPSATPGLIPANIEELNYGCGIFEFRGISSPT
jgi:hypothetical protein